MSDVNFVEYGSNFVRLADNGETFVGFLESNGGAIGFFLAFLLIIFFLGLLAVLMWAGYKRLVNNA